MPGRRGMAGGAAAERIADNQAAALAPHPMPLQPRSARAQDRGPEGRLTGIPERGRARSGGGDAARAPRPTCTQRLVSARVVGRWTWAAEARPACGRGRSPTVHSRSEHGLGAASRDREPYLPPARALELALRRLEAAVLGFRGLGRWRTRLPRSAASLRRFLRSGRPVFTAPDLTVKSRVVKSPRGRQVPVARAPGRRLE